MNSLRLLFIHFCFFLGASSSFAQAFLSYEQFEGLSEGQQKNYIEDLQKLSVSLGSQKEFSEQTHFIFERFYHLFVPRADGLEMSRLNQVCQLKSAKNLSHSELFSKITQTRSCSEVVEKGQRSYFVSSVPLRLQLLTDEFNSRVQSGRITPRTPGYDQANGDLRLLKTELKARGVRGTSSLLSNRPSAPAPMPVPKATTILPVGQLAQCLYAGFLIPKNSQKKCLPFKELPAEFGSDFFESSSFVCASSEQILCNPLLFGYENICQKSDQCQKKPVCVWRSQEATKNCFESAQRKKTLQQTLTLWKSPQGKSLYEKYVQSLEQLCDSQNLKARNLRSAVLFDIETTCQVAFQVMAHNVKNKYLPDPRAREGLNGSKAKTAK